MAPPIEDDPRRVATARSEWRTMLAVVGGAMATVAEARGQGWGIRHLILFIVVLKKAFKVKKKNPERILRNGNAAGGAQLGLHRIISGSIDAIAKLLGSKLGFGE